MRMYDIIDKKRRGERLCDEEISFAVDGYTAGDIPDYQMSAFLMAVCLVGMDKGETVALTKAMRDSGDHADLSAFGALSVDKHSTGGVGDKTSLIVAPTVAALGAKVAKMSGRGLGHTGGTVDKLESIPGVLTSMEPDRFTEQVKSVGVAVIGQSGNFAPADKKIYALRDVTATISSIPLIASSIMSKKLAAGAETIVLDVKTGSGAFMHTLEDSEALAKEMVDIGTSCGKKVRAVITNMDIPLGNAVGNSIEVLEAAELLSGKDSSPDLYSVCVELAANMISLCFSKRIEDAKAEVEDCIKSGKALAKFKEWIKAQGGNTEFIEKPELIFKPKFEAKVLAQRDGYISHINTELVGKSASALGAGREKKDDVIDFSAGIRIAKKTGAYVKKGDLLATLYADDKGRIPVAEEMFLSAYEFSESKPDDAVIVYKTIG